MLGPEFVILSNITVKNILVTALLENIAKSCKITTLFCKYNMAL